MIDDASTAPPLPAAPELPPALPPDSGWQRLPLRAASMAAVGSAVTALVVVGGALGVPWVLLKLPLPGWAVAVIVAVAVLFGAVFGFRRQRRTWWRLDARGLGVRRDLMWQLDTRVPLSRVQHLDLRRGPIERAAQLATLVVHTAGSRFSAVTLSGLDHADAERLRDTLGRQLDQDDDAL